MRRSILCAITAVAVVLGSCRAADDSTAAAPDVPADEASNSGVQGAWGIAEHRPMAGTPARNPAGVFLFSATHYSIMYSTQAGPRATFADADAPSDSERLSAFATFVANSGTYTLNGDTLAIRPVISKHPNYMGGGEDRYTVRLAGDTLWLTSIAGAFRWAHSQISPDTTDAVEAFTLIRAR